MPLSPERKTWYFERLKDLIENHTKIFLVQVRCRIGCSKHPTRRSRRCVRLFGRSLLRQEPPDLTENMKNEGVSDEGRSYP